MVKKSIAASLILLLAVAAVPFTARAQTQTSATPSRLSIPITGSGSGGTFNGVFQLERFAVDQGQVVASGLLTGTVTNASGTTSVVQNVALPVTVGQATCQILHLDLGPLSLTLLGLQIDLSRVVLDITAQPGAGNLLGNLLCAVANVLNNPTNLVQLLNSILSAL